MSGEQNSPELEILDAIGAALKQLEPGVLQAISFDGDNTSEEFIVTHRNGKDYKILVAELGVWDEAEGTYT